MKRPALVLALAAFFACTGLRGEARAIPRYSARYRQNCSLCHENPTGGGLRSLYASQYLLPAEMAMVLWKQEDLQKIRPNINDNITFGLDLRTMHHYSTSSQEQAPNFFEMQGDVYVAFQLSPHFLGYVSQGQFRSEELFGAAYILPFNGYVKVGRFTPEFGWKFEDHTHFTRELVVRQPPANTDVGVELGSFPKGVALAVSVLNGAPDSQLYDDNNILGYAYRALYRFGVRQVGLGFGASYYTNSSRQGLQRTGGPFGYADWWRLTWLWEVDASRLDPHVAAATRSLVTSHELSYQIVRGLSLLATYDFADPDIDRKTGLRLKYSGGLDALITPYAGLRGQIVAYQDRDRGAAGQRYTESQVQLHVYY